MKKKITKIKLSGSYKVDSSIIEVTLNDLLEPQKSKAWGDEKGYKVDNYTTTKKENLTTTPNITECDHCKKSLLERNPSGYFVPAWHKAEDSSTPNITECDHYTYCDGCLSTIHIGEPSNDGKCISVNGGTCLKCGEENINIVGPNYHRCTPENKENKWEEELRREIKYLLFEYKDQGDDSRIANVLEKVDELLQTQRETFLEAFKDLIRNEYLVDGYVDCHGDVLIEEVAELLDTLKTKEDSDE